MALTDKLTNIAEAIRGKTGKTDAMTLEQMATEIEGISAGGGDGFPIGDGNTHLWITLREGRTSPMLGVCPNGTVTVDWGDGTAPDVLTGTSTSTVKYTPTHNYASAGDYMITLTVDGDVGFTGDYGASYLLRHSAEANDTNTTYVASVKRIELGNNATFVGNYAFYNCYSLASVEISSGVTRIGDSAFHSCYSLASVAIPDSVTSIGKSAFERCYSLASVAIPDSVTSIGGVTFNTCYSLASVAIPDSVTSIGSSMFSNCYSLASVAIPDSVTSIGGSAFYNCYSLASVAIPDSVTSIGGGAFYNCYGAAFYDFKNHTAVPTLSGTNAFANIPADCEIRVPAALYDEWIAATNWSTYASKIVAV